MKATLFYEHGDASVLKYTDFPTPEPGPGEVLVKLHAAALNHNDLWVRQGWDGIKLEYPHIPGCDGAGEVAAIGSGVTDWKAGNRVVINANLGCGRCKACINGHDNLCSDWHLLGETLRGTYAQYVCVPSRQLLGLPANVDYHLASAAGLVYHTAWHSLLTRGNLQPEESILIVGASGGVNTAAIQIAKSVGSKVFVVGSSDQKLKLAESLGADVLINRTKTPDWAREVYAQNEKHGVDVVFDNVGTTFPLSFRAARKGGRILTVGNTGGPKFEIDNRYIFAKQLSIIGSTMGTLKDFAEVMTLVFTSTFQPALDLIFPLRDAHFAQQRLERGEQLGKITLRIEH